MKHFLVVLSILFFGPIDVLGQTQLQKITNFQSDRKSFNHIATSERDKYTLVSDDKNRLLVLTIDSIGQLKIIFESSQEFCNNYEVVSASIDDTNIYVFSNNKMVIENILTGEIRENTNVNLFNNRKPKVQCYDNKYYALFDVGYYLFDRNTDEQVFQSNSYPIKIKDIIIETVYSGNTAYYQVVHIPSKKVTKLNQDYRLNSYEYESEEAIFQNYSSINVSQDNLIVSFNQGGTIDTLQSLLPKFSKIAKAKSASHYLAILTDYSFNSNFEETSIIYKIDSLSSAAQIIDTISGFSDVSYSFINDSLILYSHSTGHLIKNLNTKKEKEIDLPVAGYLHRKFDKYLLFAGEAYWDYYVYNLDIDSILKVAKRDLIVRYKSTYFIDDEKIYFFNTDNLNYPLWEVSSKVKSIEQNIAKIASKNGFRTSNIYKSENYIFSFDNQSIVVIESSSSNGYKSAKIVDSTYNLILEDQVFYIYNDVVYFLAPKINFEAYESDIISIDLSNMIVTNLTTTFGLPIVKYNYVSQVKGSEELLYWDDYIFDTKLSRLINVEAELQILYGFRLIKIGNHLKILESSKFNEYSYPDLSLIGSDKYSNIFQVAKKYVAYTSENKNILNISDGTKKVQILSNGKIEFPDLWYLSELKEVVSILTNNGKTLQAYKIINDSNVGLRTELFYEKSGFQGTLYIYPHHKYYVVVFSNGNNVNLIIYEFESSKMYEINDIESRSIIDIYENVILVNDFDENRIIKYDFDGNILSTATYPKNYNISIKKNYGENPKGLYIFKSYSNELTYLFDSESMSFIPLFECLFNTDEQNNQTNFVYLDSIYFINVATDSIGFQTHAFKNPYDGRQAVKAVNVDLKELLIVPNPAIQTISLQNIELSEMYEVKIYDILGFEILSVFNSENIDVSSLKKGTYFVDYVSNRYRYIGRFIKL